jgi:hypothetical protein
MTELDLNRLLVQGARRLRVVAALRAGLATLGVLSVATATGIFIWRTAEAIPAAQLQDSVTTQLTLALLPFAGALLILCGVYLFRKSPARTVAAELDRAAQLKDHLLTWMQLRGLQLPPAQEAFRAAQQSATLERASGLRPAALLPLKLPAWAPALWLTVVLLSCALLVPPQIATETRADAREQARERRLKMSALELDSGGADRAGGETQNTPRVQPLSPTELWKLQLRVSDPTLSTEQRRELLNDLQRKTGGIPESELTAEIRDLLNILREPDKSTVEASPSSVTPAAPGGSAQQQAVAPAESEAMGEVGAANAALLRARGLALAKSEFPDVKEALIRYYTGGETQ